MVYINLKVNKPYKKHFSVIKINFSVIKIIYYRTHWKLFLLSKNYRFCFNSHP